VNAGLRVPGASFARQTCLARRHHPLRPALPVARSAPCLAALGSVGADADMDAALLEKVWPLAHRAAPAGRVQAAAEGRRGRLGVRTVAGGASEGGVFADRPFRAGYPQVRVYGLGARADPPPLLQHKRDRFADSEPGGALFNAAPAKN